MCSLSFADWMLFFTAVFTGGLLLVAWLAYNKLLVQEASKEQLKIVNELVHDIVYTGIKLVVYNFSGPSMNPLMGIYNIFSYAQFNIAAVNENFDAIISKSLYNKDLEKVIQHLGNPLLPPSISTSIMQLRKLPKFFPFIQEQYQNPYYILGSEEIGLENIKTYTQLKIEGGINGWIRVCIDVQNSIINWYKEKGVKEFNHHALQ
jgi:hypothetical protein